MWRCLMEEKHTEHEAKNNIQAIQDPLKKGYFQGP